MGSGFRVVLPVLSPGLEGVPGRPAARWWQRIEAAGRRRRRVVENGRRAMPVAGV